ncbi:uncharacterized protein LOC134712602 [Mytilus trossulus]|uniref:uncharacterized protein LOC134687165 n=1 Tax=Mytilus trossulus TaxID=6551 RepID=UPI00300419EB
MPKNQKKRGPYNKRRKTETGIDEHSDNDQEETVTTCSKYDNHDIHTASYEEDTIAVVIESDNIGSACSPSPTCIPEDEVPSSTSAKNYVDETFMLRNLKTSSTIDRVDINTVVADQDCIDADMDNSSVISEDHITNTVNINQRTQNFEYNELVNEEIDELPIDGQLADTEFADEENASVIIDPIAETIIDETPNIPERPNPTENEVRDTNIPLYVGCSKSVGLILLMICSLSIRFKLSDEALSYIIAVMNMIMPDENNMIKSVYTVKEYLKKFVNFPTIHYLCSHCGTHTQKDAKTCTNKHCEKDLTQFGSVGYFIQHSVIAQLQLMAKRSSFLQKIRSYRFDHYSKNPDNNYRDIYDGSNYKNVFQKGFLKNPNSISFSMNTDGVQIFKSSSMSMWPVFMIINELPPSERKLKENIVYYGLWIGAKKPLMWSYLKPLHEELCKLEDGVELVDNCGSNFTLMGTLLNCVCDLPARCLVSNSMQFNGKYGCWFCLQPGETYTTNKGGHVHIFPYCENEPKGPLRTVENLQDDVNQVVGKIQTNEKNFIVRGIKGPFWFMFLKHFNVIHGFVIDYMHGVCAGVMKMLLTLWFDKQHKTENFSMFIHKGSVNTRLSSIHPNLHITRPPRSLDDLSHWKSAEYRNFLFLWSLPVLHDILPNEYYLHFSLLVRGIYNLARENVSDKDLKNAERCLFLFIENFPNLYSSRYLTMNCHQLLHITDCVRANGPLFVNNCFAFEDLNGYIIKNIHGTTGIEMQVINAITKMQALPTLQELHIDKGSTDEALFNSMTRPNFIHNADCIEEGIFHLGQTFKMRLDDSEYTAVCDFLGTCLPQLDIVEYKKIFITKISSAVYGTSYGRLLKRNQSVVKYDALDVVHFGSVKTFIQIENFDGGILNVALIHPFTTLLSYTNQQSCHQVTTQFENIVAVPLQNILKVCTFVKCGKNLFVVEFPNKYEKD